MSSTLYVDKVVEKTSAAGVHIPGHVIQVQQYQAGGSTLEVSTNNFTATSMTVTITPKFTTSKIILHASWPYWFAADSNNYCIGTIYRGSSNLGIGGYNGLTFNGPMRNSSYNNQAHMDYMDSPNTTSATTYTVYVRPYNYNTSLLRVGWTSQLSFLSAMEIAQ